MNDSALCYQIAHSYTKCASDQEIKKTIEPLFPKIDKFLRVYVYFNFLFIFLALAEFIALFLFFNFLAESAYLALSFGLIFLTFFSYFLLRLYFQTQKQLQLEELKNEYEKEFKIFFKYDEKNPENLVTLANAYCKLANSLHKKESKVVHLPKFFQKKIPPIDYLLEKLSSWWLFEDVHKMKEILLKAAVEEHIKVVKCEPTARESHAALGNAYVMLSGLYASDEKIKFEKGDKRMIHPKFLNEMEKKFKMTAERAMEEFKVLSDIAPQDAWVHKQLAYSYHDLQMPIEEINEYEIVLKINPDDKETLFRLGILYFQQGFNAKGLRLYEELKKFNTKKAEQLIKFYAVYSPF